MGAALVGGVGVGVYTDFINGGCDEPHRRKPSIRIPMAAARLQS